ncbi:hypothetical protein K0T92_08205 [Paenibacillus oenotherae]|uniref:DUF4239 domain-containing protein n=1 Tax=Paenibacillus oenotherae TaxID=1435645 RepID=A0ABS7D5H4_9BACL|nr:hypothetical protein [Paenibacillus oenotherae]MBW7474726.1 hypothetical protein [Paenibacillus oenotherae]
MEKILIDLFMNSKIEVLFWTLFIWVILWVFKEIRTKYIKDGEAANDEIRKLLEVYGQLELVIDRYRNDQSDENRQRMSEEMANAYPYISRKLFKKWTVVKEASYRIDETNAFQEALTKEIAQHKYEQSNRSPIFRGEGTMGNFEYFMGNFKSFITPMILTFFALMMALSVFLLLHFIYDTDNDWRNKVWIFFNVFNFVLFLIVFIQSMEHIFDKHYRHSLWNWNVTLLFIIIFILSLNHWMSAVCFFSVVILYGLYYKRYIRIP